MNLPTNNDFEWQYNPRKSVTNVQEYAQRASDLSTRARSRHKPICDVQYGTSPLATLDIFLAIQSDAPVHVFLHGGFWRGRDKSDYSYIADALIPLGITTVVMNYDLCPKASLPEIVAQVRQGIRWIYAHAHEFSSYSEVDLESGGKNPIFVTFSGHSAGAHLLAAALAADRGESLVPVGQSTAAVLISGIYELEPVLSISVNAEIQLQPEQVDAMSPMRHPPLVDVPLQIVVGGGETPSWVQQSRSFADVCLRQGSDCTYRELQSHHHYSIMTLLETPDSILTKIIRDVATAPRRAPDSMQKPQGMQF